MIRILCIALTVVGCGSSDGPTATRTVPEPPACTFYPDRDGDGFGDASAKPVCDPPSAGYTANATDCDDDDPDVNPNARERCDDGQTDEDCDGLYDDADLDPTGGVSTWPDRDGDGFGDRNVKPEGTCVVTADRSFDGTDCDDTDADTYVGAAAAEDAWLCMTDRDGDGWGAADPAEGVVAGSDCDDDDALFSPDATDIFGDGIDQDCSGEDLWWIGDDFESGDADAAVWVNPAGSTWSPGAAGTGLGFRTFADEMVTEPIDARRCDTLAWELYVGPSFLTGQASGLAVEYRSGAGWVTLARFDEYLPEGFTRLGGPIVDPAAFGSDLQIRLGFGPSSDLVIDEFRLMCPGPDGDGDGYGQLADCDDTDPRHFSDCGTCVDLDDDGYGEDCDLGADCDDTNPDARPGGNDVDTNGVDEDCNNYDGLGFFDDFELGTRDRTIWEPPSGDAIYTDWRATGGSWSLELGNDGTYTSAPIDMSGCGQLYVSLGVQRLEATVGERLELLVFDGASWTVAGRVNGNGGSDGAAAHYSALVTDPAAIGPHSRLRLQGVGGGTFSWSSYIIDDVLFECSGPDTDGDGVPSQHDWDDADPRYWTGPCTDGDRDGYGAGCDLGPDCDDGDAQVSPEASDPWGDGADTNCDGYDGHVLFDDFNSGVPDPDVWATLFETSFDSWAVSPPFGFLIDRDDYAETATLDTTACPSVVWAFEGRRVTPPPGPSNELVLSYWDGARWVEAYAWPGKGSRDDDWSSHLGTLSGPGVANPVFRMRFEVSNLATRRFVVDDVFIACSEPDTDGDGIAGVLDCAPDDGRHWSDCGACVDPDDDGYGVNCDLGPDCLPTVGDVNPGAADPYGDGIDQDCSGADGTGWTDGFEAAGPTSMWTYTQPLDWSDFESRSGSHSLLLQGQGGIELASVDASGCSVLDWSFHTLRGWQAPDVGDDLVVSWFDGTAWQELHRVAGGAMDTSFQPHSGSLSLPPAVASDFRLRFVLDATGSYWTDEIHLDDFALHCVP